MWTRLFLFGALCIVNTLSIHVHHAVETEMFSIPISPNLFNWTYQEFDQQYRFHASLVGKPELPTWLRYIYSGRHHSGFIFGTPPRGTKLPITLEIVGLNRQDYETRRVQISLEVHPKLEPAMYEVEFKIDNLNVEDLLDEHRMTSLKDILRTKLWTESSHDLYPTFLASAIDLGARLPLKPSDGEGLVIRLGSAHPFSSALKNLREEVRPLSRLPSCPRDYKRTTVERLFRDIGFALDWCSFELYNTIYDGKRTTHLEYLTKVPDKSNIATQNKALDTHDVWTAPSLYDLPSRSYMKHLTTTVAVPLAVFVLCIAALTAILCLHYATVHDPVSDNFIANIFHICVDYKSRRAHRSAKVELCRYGTGNTDQTQVADNTSNRSLEVSPNNSLARPYSPKSSTNLAGSYNRPQPPPYGTNSLHHRKVDKTPSSGHTPEPRVHLALEESIKLLNEAKINALESDLNPIIDLADGGEDYVPLKPDSTGYISMKADSTGYVSLKPDLKELDNIDVPELSKYGMGVVGSI